MSEPEMIVLLSAIGTIYYAIYKHHETSRSKGGTRNQVKVAYKRPFFPDPPMPSMNITGEKPSMTAPQPPRPVTVKPRDRIMSYQCMDCAWNARDLHQSLIVKQCPKCHGPVMTGERR